MRTKAILVLWLLLVVFFASASGQQTAEDWLDKGITLGAVNSTRAIEPLILVLKDDDPYIAWIARSALIGIGKPAVEPLIEALKDDDRTVRGGAALALGKISDVRAVEPLIQSLKDGDEDPTFRGAAAFALGEINDTRAIEPLIDALKDDEPYVRGHAASAPGEINDTRAIEPLIQALKGDDDSDVRVSAGVALTHYRLPPSLEKRIWAEG